MEGVRIATFLIVWLLWAVLGFLFWIPLLTRATASLAAAVLYCTVTESDPSYMQKSFESAVSFYARGFQILEKVFFPKKNDSDKKDSVSKLEDKWGRVILELIWTVVFWGSLLLFIASVFFDYSLTNTITDAFTPNQPAKVYYDRGDALSDEKKFQAAIIEFNKALKADPKFALAYFGRGYCNLSLNNLDESLVDFDEYLKFNPNDSSAYYNKAVIYKAQRKSDLAIQNFNKVIDLSNNEELTQKAKQHLQSLGIQ